MEVGIPISTIIVYVGLVIIAICVIYSIYLCYFIIKKKKRGSGSKRKATTADEAKVPQKAVADSIADNGSSSTAKKDQTPLDHQYAISHGMWICKYCETINSYPDGYIPRKQSEYEEKIVVSSSSSGLRGDLLNKSNKRYAKQPPESSCLLCVACGKSQ